MRQLTAIIGFLLFMAYGEISQAQQASIRGVITDTSNQKKLENAVISLLKKSDSVLVTFTRSNKDGAFILEKLPAGEFVMLISYPSFADFVDPIKLEPNSALEIGDINLTLKSVLLKEIVIRQNATMRLRGDTVEYSADSFNVRPGATVEDLLKKMPGIQVDKDGKITAQGTNVEKVLVDGEEFFGDDPTVATRNLQADAIDKVQVFDKKSDQAAFTGIDDGQSKKTINLKLKEDKKKGYFGKLELGGGLNDRWNNSAMFNRFRAKKKLSIYGIASSTGKTGLNWEERNTYGSGNDNMEYNDDFGGFMFYGGGDEFNNSNYYGEGLPRSWATGINYSNKFDADRQNFNGSYRFNKLNSEGLGNTISQSISPDTVFYNTEGRRTFNSRNRHSVNGTYEWNIDSATSLKIIASGYLGKQSTFSDYHNESLNEFGDTVLKSVRQTSADGDNSNLKLNALLRHKFKKTGRTISLSLDQQFNNSSSDGFLYALVSTYGKLGLPEDSTTNQLKQISQQVSTFNTRLVYTEPLAKKIFLELNYSIRSNSSDAERLSYNQSGSGKFDDLDSTFSNHYKFDVLSNTTGAAFKYNGKKFTGSIGSDISFQRFNQKDQLNDTALVRNYTNFFPRANIVYKFSSNGRVSLNYNGSSRQPSIQQIQPVADNTNPLAITIGNPLLKQEFRHNFNFNFNSFKVLSERGIYIYGSFSTTSNAIVQSTRIDTSGKMIYQYINTNGNFNTWSGGGYGMKLKKWDLRINGGFGFNASKYTTIVNGEKNVTNNYQPQINFNMGKFKDKKYEIWYNGSFGYNFSRQSIRTDLKTTYWTQDHNLNVNVQLPHKFEINTEIEYNLRQKTVVFDQNNNVFLWNGYIGRKFLKNDKGMIRISAYDILNQNKGYNRVINTNVLREDTYQTLTRYFLLSFVWNFSKTPAGSTNP